MIRHDSTNYKPNKDRHNWTNRAYTEDAARDHDAEKREDLLNAWKAIGQSGDTAKIKEYELARRISAVTEGDNSANRTAEVIKRYIVADEYEERRRARVETGQTEEEFAKEVSRWVQQSQNDYAEAQRIVDRELATSKQVYAGY